MGRRPRRIGHPAARRRNDRLRLSPPLGPYRKQTTGEASLEEHADHGQDAEGEGEALHRNQGNGTVSATSIGGRLLVGAHLRHPYRLRRGIGFILLPIQDELQAPGQDLQRQHTDWAPCARERRGSENSLTRCRGRPSVPHTHVRRSL